MLAYWLGHRFEALIPRPPVTLLSPRARYPLKRHSVNTRKVQNVETEQLVKIKQVY
jgi:hypothetical protein